ncbi:MAG: hypothetical protein M1483_05940 [Actinobacteria bacterium]|nr:hypothetical protein [Actinomycetota bacterium]MCL6105149.1 hypothetical protein [Actinomycetota bacterium]
MDTLEIIRQIEADPALRAQLRAVLLGDDLINLPGLVAENSRLIKELIASQHVIVDRLDHTEKGVGILKEDVTVIKEDVTVIKEDVTVIKEDVTVLKEDVTVLKEDVTVLKEDVTVLKEDVTVLKEDVTVIKEDIKVMKNDIGDLKGNQMETRWRGWKGRFRRIDIVQSIFAPISNDDMDDLIVKAEDSGLITKKEGEYIEMVDIVFPVIFKDKSEGYLAVEVSVNIEKNDFTRAIKRAKILSKMTQKKCIPVAVGTNIMSPPPEELYVLTDQKIVNN